MLFSQLKNRLKSPESSSSDGESPEEAQNQGFGTFQGVFIPSILTILGVILYLRLGWVVGQVGFSGAAIIITLSSLITFLTALSISSTATNMKVQGGGAYFMVSRSFGLEAGAAIGIPLFFAQAIGIAFYITGFSESIHALLPALKPSVIGLGALLVMGVLAYTSSNLALKMQVFIFVAILASLISFVLGHRITPEEADSIHTVASRSVGFWAIFAVFFPAVTGIEAGISMSGDLKNPSRSLPIGTILSVVTGFVIYLGVAFVLSMKVPSSLLKSNPMIMSSVALYPPLIMLGIWCATLSSALGALLGGPRTLQALSFDKILPQFLSKSHGKNQEPRIATAFTFLIAGVAIWFGDLDLIAPVLSMFFLTSYGTLNLIAGFEGLISNPSWRPTFRTPWVLSMLAAFLCLFAMLMIDAGATFIAIFLCTAIYLFTKKRKLNSRWSDLRRSLLSYMARGSIYRLSNYQETAKTWRPHFMVMSGSPKSRWYLIAICNAITQSKGFLTVCSLIFGKEVDASKRLTYERSIAELLNKNRVSALVKVNPAEDIVTGVTELVNWYGLGSITPNTFVFGETEKEDNYIDFCSAIKVIYKSQRNTLIIRESSRPFDESTEEIQTQRKIKGKQIDIWWGRQQNNATLMLTLAYMLQNSSYWVGATVTLKSLVESEDQRQGILANLREFVEEGRIDVGVEVFVKGSEEESIAAIRKYSIEADLVFIGMRPPKEEETAHDYSDYYESLIERTERFPLLIVTLAGEDIKFKEIFS